MPNKVQIALLVGGGSRVPALLKCARKLSNIEIVCVLSCLDRGMGTVSLRKMSRRETRGQGIYAEVIAWSNFKRKENGRYKFSQRAASILREKDIDLVISAGWVVLMPPVFVHEFRWRIVNIHPSILPEYPGNGVKAIHAQWEEEFARRKAEESSGKTGCTLHFIDEGIDTGRHLIQGYVDPRKLNSEEELAEAIHTKEDEVLCKFLKLVSENEVDGLKEAKLRII